LRAMAASRHWMVSQSMGELEVGRTGPVGPAFSAGAGRQEGGSGGRWFVMKCNVGGQLIRRGLRHAPSFSGWHPY
jgi:hypothetical protein